MPESATTRAIDAFWRRRREDAVAAGIDPTDTVAMAEFNAQMKRECDECNARRIRL